MSAMRVIGMLTKLGGMGQKWDMDDGSIAHTHQPDIFKTSSIIMGLTVNKKLIKLGNCDFT
jgi:hypothetical protein